MHSGTEKVVEQLRAHGVTGDVVDLPDRAATAATAAAQLGCEVDAIANSLVFAADDEPLLVLTSGAHRVDTKRVAREHGFAKVKRADPDFVRDATGQTIGGVAPIGHPAPIRTLVDRTLADHDVVWAAAGHPHTVFRTTYDELLRITKGEPGDVAAD